MTNNCAYDCLYCVNRRSNDVKRTSITPRELCELVINFYRRNYIEGLFLSSAVEKSPDHTMQLLIQAIEMLRTEYSFRGYIHLKAIPGADSALIIKAARYADRMSVNIELPTEKSLMLLAPQKKKEAIVSPMKQLADIYHITKHEKPETVSIPAGQTTQMIIGASGESDAQIVRLTEGLYNNFRLKRVYYSAYVPVNNHSLLPAVPVDLRREHRLYEADWLLRFYGFRAEEILPENCNLALDIDVKSDWALNNYAQFPVEVNSASYETLLRVPGIGVKNAYRIVSARRYGRLTLETLKQMRVVTKRAGYFITVNGKHMGATDNPEAIRRLLAGEQKFIGPQVKRYEQLTMFDAANGFSGEF
jgi:putative DNA modification/repair radical SAM protein